MAQIYSRTNSKKLWNERIHNWQKSGKNISAWCQEHNVNYRQFIYWKVLLLGKRKKQSTSNFIELAPTSSQQALMFEVGGFRIQISQC